LRNVSRDGDDCGITPAVRLRHGLTPHLNPDIAWLIIGCIPAKTEFDRRRLIVCAAAIECGKIGGAVPNMDMFQ
jgi:hypothetical protein